MALPALSLPAVKGVKQRRIPFNRNRQVLPTMRWSGGPWGRKTLWFCAKEKQSSDMSKQHTLHLQHRAVLRHRCLEKAGLSVFTRQAPQPFFKACHLHLVMARCISPQASQQSLRKQQHKTFGLLPAELARTTFLSLLFSLHSIDTPALPRAPGLAQVTSQPCVMRMPYACPHLTGSPPSPSDPSQLFFPSEVI